MLDWVQDTRLRGWWRDYRDVFNGDLLPDYETEAAHLRNYETQIFPALLQVPGYSAAVLRGAGRTDPADISRHVEARMCRREILVRMKPARLHAVVDESTFLRPIGGPTVMVEQLDYLLHMAQLPNIDLRVLPLAQDAHAGLVAPFTVLEFAHPLDTPIVCVPSLTQSLYLEQEDEVEAYQAAFRSIQEAAADPAASVALVERHRERMRELL
ncbi:DUF5753 domain-containing protein [Nocardiopsis algeriensis]|uniref:DUF5753 domain-containing protein n=1 Tax=Nocardiopsis algeriensis TaxID=1478215 RepID=A0A841IVQ0_9ACTN|nr:DUF5753 domain-containing protein [Nocardiopsis algeriensis]MBB6120281.1 hypothetical protein [Nocardiopsis algeriensis]